MAKPTQGYSQHDDRNVWNQRKDDVGKTGDNETMKIFGQMTGSGIINTETGKKNGGNDRKK